MLRITLPPLRERRADIPLLLDHFRKVVADAHGREAPNISRAARHALVTYDWPGNIRQLRNAVESMLVNDIDGLMDIDDLPEDDMAPITLALDQATFDPANPAAYLKQYGGVA